ncbi:MAG TPA: DUF5329 domain-containing protein [Spirochaetota bacterium]|nr:DUF5329 domain-containing protein [Spirochaetota bacterium]HPC41520.1 DUF5329 domain-containing protein [Spirochaetota bacterium]HPL15593.1 DUF5329 domain-containing protein [Spirochaetota bacterium]HQF09112.1 DUF5329 domain-containing protein [Spirochaetota bacterium]HQH97663.1 DUF5329 domain-containing protein [Spirochaetota bacterium]
MNKRAVYLVMAVLLSVARASAMSEQEKIQALLGRIEQSGLIFVRNGSAYSPTEARKHLELKLSKAGSAITTAEQFITHIASGSSWTGTPYYIRLRDGTLVKSSDWLRKNLAELEKGKR